MRLAILANPAASGFSGDALRRVTGILRNRYEVDQLWPSAAGGIEATVRSAIDSGAEVVAAMGGDGVAHHAAAALVGTSATMAFIPVGTTNVLARILGIPADPVQPPKLVSDPRPIDLAVAGPGQRGNRHRRHHRHLLRRDRARRRHRPAGRGRAVPQVPDGWSALSPHLRTALGSYVGRPASLRVDDGDRRRRRRRARPGPRALHLSRPVPASACTAPPLRSPC